MKAFQQSPYFRTLDNFYLQLLGKQISDMELEDCFLVPQMYRVTNVVGDTHFVYSKAGFAFNRQNPRLWLRSGKFAVKTAV